MPLRVVCTIIVRAMRKSWKIPLTHRKTDGLFVLDTWIPDATLYCVIYDLFCNKKQRL